MYKLLAKLTFKIEGKIADIKSRYIISKLGACGENTTIGRGFNIENPENVFIGKNTFINSNVTLMSSDSKIFIGNNVMLSSGIYIITGDHRSDVVGEYMINVKEKLPENDKEVIIEDDVWIGAGAIILKGTRIGRGSIIGAGAVVASKDIPPYSVCAGNPARIIKSRFSPERIEEHEKIIKEKYGDIL